jgi:hypothetical protein
MFRFLSFIIKRDNILIIEKTSHVALTYDTLTVPDNPSGTLGTVHRAFENEELHAKNCVFFLNLYEKKRKKEEKIVPRACKDHNLVLDESAFAINNDTCTFLPITSNLVHNCFIIVKRNFFSFLLVMFFS